MAVVQYTFTNKQYTKRYKTNNTQNDTKQKIHRTTQQFTQNNRTINKILSSGGRKFFCIVDKLLPDYTSSRMRETVKRHRLSDYLSTKPVGSSFTLECSYGDLLSLMHFNINMWWSVTQRTENIQSTCQYITFCRTLTLSWQQTKHNQHFHIDGQSQDSANCSFHKLQRSFLCWHF